MPELETSTPRFLAEDPEAEGTTTVTTSGGKLTKFEDGSHRYVPGPGEGLTGKSLVKFLMDEEE